MDGPFVVLLLAVRRGVRHPGFRIGTAALGLFSSGSVSTMLRGRDG
jgi:hypothetical protein